MALTRSIRRSRLVEVPFVRLDLSSLLRVEEELKKLGRVSISCGGYEDVDSVIEAIECAEPGGLDELILQAPGAHANDGVFVEIGRRQVASVDLKGDDGPAAVVYLEIIDILRTYAAKRVGGWRSLTSLGWPGFIGAIFISLIYQSAVPLPPYSGITVMYWCFLIMTLVLCVGNSVLIVLARPQVRLNPEQASWIYRNRDALIVALVGSLIAGIVIIMWWSFAHG